MKEFLKQMREAGEEHSASQDFLTVAKMRIQFGYSGFVSGERGESFFKPYGNPKDAGRVALEVTERLKGSGSKQDSVFAILLDVPEETNSGEKVKWSIKQVTFTNNDEDSEYQTLFNALDESDCPINEWFWGSYKNIVTGTYEKDGVMKKRYLSLPAEHFKNEADAMASVGGKVGSTSSHWSDFALGIYDSANDIEKLSDQVLDWYEKAKKGIAYNDDAENFPLPVPLTPPAAKGYIAEIYQIEPGDIDLMVPF